VSDEELDVWLEYAQRVGMDSMPLGGAGLARDVVTLWNVIGALGAKIRQMEEAL
jgi:hypothetical protein